MFAIVEIPKPPPAAMKWVERSVIIRANSRVYAPDAMVYGTLAVHRPVGVDGAEYYVVTHTPSYRLVGRTRIREDAVLLVETLYDACPQAFEERGVDIKFEAIPKEARLWLEKCYQVMFVSPLAGKPTTG